MSLLQGPLSFHRLMVLGPVPDESDRNAGLVQDQYRPFQDGLEEERVGWCDWRNPMLTPPDADWIEQDRFWVFSLRIDTRRVPSELLKAHVDLRLAQLQKEKDLAFIGKEARITIADEVKVLLLRKVLPTMKSFSIAWDWRKGLMYTTATSKAAQGALTSLLIKSFGVEVRPMGPLLLAGALAPRIPVEGLMALDPLDLSLEGVER